MDNRAIGIFDSGLGGLTAVLEMQKTLPNENLIYFGDTGRVPYGTRSKETIEKYTREDINFLIKKGVKFIIAACGTVSSVALPIVKDDYDVNIIGVVESACDAALDATKNKKIGILGTTATIKSGIYKKYIENKDNGAKVFEKACPLFVPLVENGFIETDNQVTKLVVEKYLAELKDAGVDTLILGCTHFPLISDIINDFFEDKVSLINSGAEVVKRAKSILEKEDLLNDASSPAKREFFVSDSIDGFKSMADMIFGKSDDHHNISRVIITED
jgi:glutamate racemase